MYSTAANGSSIQTLGSGTLVTINSLRVPIYQITLDTQACNSLFLLSKLNKKEVNPDAGLLYEVSC